MDFRFSHDQETLRRSARDYLRHRAPLRVARAVLESGAPYDADLWQGVAGLGWPGTAVPGQYGGDPTRGQFVNSTAFQLKVYVDVDPARESSAPYLTMIPSEVFPVNLDVGNHRVVAVATRDTQFGPRSVGRYDNPVRVDVRGSGWELRFREGDFN